MTGLLGLAWFGFAHAAPMHVSVTAALGPADAARVSGAHEVLAQLVQDDDVVWSDTLEGIVFVDGQYSVVLGAGKPLDHTVTGDLLLSVDGRPIFTAGVDVPVDVDFPGIRDVPVQITFTADAADASGAPVDGVHDVVVTNVDDGSVVWTDTVRDVSFDDGRYTVVIGTGAVLAKRSVRGVLELRVDDHLVFRTRQTRPVAVGVLGMMRRLPPSDGLISALSDSDRVGGPAGGIGGALGDNGEPRGTGGLASLGGGLGGGGTAEGVPGLAPGRSGEFGRMDIASPGVQIGGRPIILGDLPRDHVDSVVTAHLPALAACLEQSDASPSGRVVYRFTVAGDGSVSSSSVKESTLANAAVASCGAESMRTLQFDEPRGGGVVIISFPFLFQAP